jgi:hypothetical protein
VLPSSNSLKPKTTPTDGVNAKQRRQYLENYARSIGMDPLNLETWYNIMILDIKVLDKMGDVLNSLYWFFLGGKVYVPRDAT